MSSNFGNNTGVTGDSQGGFTTSGATDTSTSQTTDSYGSVGPSVGYDKNIESNDTSGEKKSGVKGLMSKINDKLGPSHPGKTDTSGQDLAKSANLYSESGAGTSGHAQANADLNRE